VPPAASGPEAGASEPSGAGVQGAEWAGHSVEVLLKVYAQTLDGQDELARRRVMEALGYGD